MFQINTEDMRFQVLIVASMKIRVFWDVAPCNLVGVDQRFRGSASITTLIMEAVHTSETSVYSNETTQCYIPED
jgi:hypothetical protein